MAIVVLVFWLFTAGAGFYLLVTSSLGRTRPAATAEPTAAAEPAAPARLSAAPASALRARLPGTRAGRPQGPGSVGSGPVAG